VASARRYDALRVCSVMFTSVDVMLLAYYYVRGAFIRYLVMNAHVGAGAIGDALWNFTLFFACLS